MGTMQITDADIEGMNRRFVARAAASARRAGACVVIMGAVTLLAWAWNTVRLQQHLEDGCSDTADVGVLHLSNCGERSRRTSVRSTTHAATLAAGIPRWPTKRSGASAHYQGPRREPCANTATQFAVVRHLAPSHPSAARCHSVAERATVRDAEA